MMDTEHKEYLQLLKKKYESNITVISTPPH